MNKSASEPVDDKSGIGETITTALRQPSILRVMLVLAAMVVVLVGIRLGAPILNPILFAVVMALLFSPVYSWLGRRRIPAPLALLIMLVVLTVLFLGLFFSWASRSAGSASDSDPTREAKRAGGQPRGSGRASGPFRRQYSRRGETQRPRRSYRRDLPASQAS